MKNPFHLKALPLTVPFCDRKTEMSDLIRYAGNFTNVVLSSPRRYGKTSLIKRIQDNLAKHGVLTIYIDYFGISSIDEFSARGPRAPAGPPDPDSLVPDYRLTPR
ncbi:MAG: hypothetical protein AAB359_07890 [Elusimicrobiota bacterium]